LFNKIYAFTTHCISGRCKSIRLINIRANYTKTDNVSYGNIGIKRIVYMVTSDITSWSCNPSIS
jgi:hypothetical protein